MITSPFERLAPERWLDVTKGLVRRHPLKPTELTAVTLTAWDNIFASRIGRFRIGIDIKPKPQIMGFLLHELIPLEFAARYPGVWRPESVGTDKDMVHVPDDTYSIELKTSSHATKVFGNRSYAQPNVISKKVRAGYYLAINFGKFQPAGRPEVTRIRFGWLDPGDWRGQLAASGQQASLAPEVEQGKLLVIYPADSKSVA